MADNSGIKRTPPNREGRSKNEGRGKHHTPLETDVRLGRIVRVLMSFPTVVISGTKLAQEIGANRSEVWRLVQQLRTLGVDIAGHPASGYQLTAVPDLLLPEMLPPFLRGTIFGEHVHHFYRVGSTNTVAMEAAAAGAPEGSVFLAEQQTAGRGRGSNQWHSVESNGIYCSVILRPALPPADVLVLSLAAGLAVHSAVQDVDSRVIPDLKWPNDVLIHGKKFCGILTEMNAEATRVRHIVVGIGINVNQAEFSGRPVGDCDVAAACDRHRVVARGSVRGFVKIARPRIPRPAGQPMVLKLEFCGDSRSGRLPSAGAKCMWKRMADSKESPKVWIRADFCRCGPRMECGRCTAER